MKRWMHVDSVSSKEYDMLEDELLHHPATIKRADETNG